MGERISELDKKYGHSILLSAIVLLGSALIYMVKDVPATTQRTAIQQEATAKVLERLLTRTDVIEKEQATMQGELTARQDWKTDVLDNTKQWRTNTNSRIVRLESHH